VTEGETSTDIDRSPTTEASGTNWKLVVATASALILLVAIGFVLLEQNQKGDKNVVARSDTQVQAVVDGYKARFPWTTPIMDAMKAEGLLTTPTKVNQLFMYFQAACVNGKDMLAGKPEATQKDLADQEIQVSADQAQRLNAAQQQMCAGMPSGAWADQPLQTRTYPGLKPPPSSPQPT
jgi:hypothetical protein